MNTFYPTSDGCDPAPLAFDLLCLRLVDLLYDHTCFLLCGVLALVPLGMMWHLHRAHVAVVWPMIRLAAEGSASASASGSASWEATPSSSERLVEQGLKLQV